MGAHTSVETAKNPAVSSPAVSSKTRAALTGAIKWSSAQLAPGSRTHSTRIRLAVIGTVILFSALGIRVLYWQDKHVEIGGGKNSLSGVFNRYQKEASRIFEEDRILFPQEPPASGDARLLAHPPGYSILLAAIYRVGGNDKWLWIVQILCDAAAALLVFLIALELLNRWVALTAAMLVALSPHLAYYSLLLTPDSLAVLPILGAVYLMIKGLKQPRVVGVMSAGALIGVSCWLTANAMLLALFLGMVVLLVFDRGKRLTLAAALVGSTIVVIAPLTIRNFVVFHRFIPLSIQAGLSLVEGIGDFDKEGKLGMPRSDREAKQMDAEWNGRPDYAVSLWTPDGIERDHTRLDRGLAVVRSHCGWFLGVMVRRAEFMISYNDSRAREWPFNTATVPLIASEAGYGHSLVLTGDEPLLPSGHSTVLMLNGEIIPGALAVKGAQPAASSTPAELYANGAVLSQQARVSLARDGQTLELAGDDSEYGDQFASAPIAVKKNTDYVLALPVSLLYGDMALKITGDDRRTSMAIGDIARATQGTGSVDTTAADSAPTPQMTTIQMPFSTGNRSEVRVVLSNNGKGTMPPAALLGAAEMFETGPSPYVWTRYARTIVRSIQRKFTTGRVLTLVAIGIALLLLARRGRTLVILLVVPLYYMTLQAPLHTEYRYILATHYFLFVMAGIPLGCFGVALEQASRQLARMAARLLTKRLRTTHL